MIHVGYFTYLISLQEALYFFIFKDIWNITNSHVHYILTREIKCFVEEDIWSPCLWGSEWGISKSSCHWWCTKGNVLIDDFSLLYHPKGIGCLMGLYFKLYPTSSFVMYVVSMKKLKLVFVLLCCDFCCGLLKQEDCSYNMKLIYSLRLMRFWRKEM